LTVVLFAVDKQMYNRLLTTTDVLLRRSHVGLRRDLLGDKIYKQQTHLVHLQLFHSQSIDHYQSNLK
jgi:hypothetical protein